MKKFWIIFWGLLIVSSTTAQTQKPCSSCLPEGITFIMQAQIDSFQIKYPECTEILGGVTIWGSDITNLNGLSVLTSIGEQFLIYNNAALTSLTGLGNLTSIGSISISDNNALTSLTGLENLTTIGSDFSIYKNSALISLSGIYNLTSVGGNLSIGFYDEWVTTGNPSLTSLEGLENLASIGGFLRIASNDALTSLTGLENLTTIGSDLIIYSNSALISLSGIYNLTSVGGSLSIGFDNGWVTAGNPSLTSLEGLENLASIGGYLRISNNPALTSLTGLVNLTSVGGSLAIVSNVALTNLTGLSNLTSIGGSLLIGDKWHGYGNPALTSLTGLENVTSIGGDLHIRENPALTSLAGLDNVTAIGGDLHIYWNDALTSLSGLNNINGNSISELRIYYNPLLSNCAVKSICDYLVSPNGTVEIHDNAQGCNSQEEVEEACGFGVDDMVSYDKVIIYPNPSSDQLIFQFTLNKPSKILLEVLNNTGQVVTVIDKSLSEGEQQVVWNAENMPTGLYFYRLTVTGEQPTATGKLMVVR
ncbi:MAG: T9SS type A sorting domain-containing protein [Bacteroidales bacterium]|nr:T9SS type A sorting domain-containing protein [Lentimicrobiaceae bacterium]MDD5694996.1 T9SS type A sorting domain-containing protein [Bacteroidales bacterium]